MCAAARLLSKSKVASGLCARGLCARAESRSKGESCAPIDNSPMVARTPPRRDAHARYKCLDGGCVWHVPTQGPQWKSGRLHPGVPHFLLSLSSPPHTIALGVGGAKSWRARTGRARLIAAVQKVELKEAWGGRGRWKQSNEIQLQITSLECVICF